MRYIPKYFKLYEWLPVYFYNKWEPVYGEGLWELLFDKRILITGDRLRERYGVMVMNDWQWRQLDQYVNQYRGYRPLDCSIGAKLSDHKKGIALDAKFKNYSVDEIREDIKKKPFDKTFEYITCIEEGVSWLHASCRERDKVKNGIQIIRP